MYENYLITLRGFKLKKKLSFFFKLIGELENQIIKSKKLNNIIFVSSFPRSGTTIITKHLSNILSSTGSVCYRDLPFIETPILWSLFSKYYYSDKKYNRIHNDKIEISPDDPEAFEEILWDNYFGEKSFKLFLKENTDHKHQNKINSFLSNDYKNFIKKILYIRKAKNYLCKNNYNIYKSKHLLEQFANSVFIIPVRDPNDTLNSLVRLDKNFQKLGNEYKGFDEFLTNTSHFEFGNKKVFITAKTTEVFQNYLNDYNFFLKKIIELKNLNEFKNRVIIINNNKMEKNLKNIYKNISNKISINLNFEKLSDLVYTNRIYSERLVISKETYKLYDEVLSYS